MRYRENVEGISCETTSSIAELNLFLNNSHETVYSGVILHAAIDDAGLFRILLLCTIKYLKL